MNNCDNCDPCPPCETQLPVTCEALDTTNDAKRVIVEDSASCKKTVPEPAQISVLQYDENNDVTWRSGSLVSPVRLPSMDAHTIDNVPRILVMRADGIVKIWTPSDTGDNYIAYWDGSAWRIGNINSLLPSGDGVLTSSGGTLSFVNGSNGDFLQIVGGNIVFSSTVPGGTPIGTVVSYAGVAAPSGWLLCDGAPYGRSSLDPSPEPNLFAVIGTTYGAGNGLTTFNVPDLRGVFVRGLDAGRGIDPLRALGTQQAFSVESHNHGGSTGAESSHTHPYSGTTNSSGAHVHYITSYYGFGDGGGQYYYAFYSNMDGVVNGYGSRTETVPSSGAHTHTISGTTGSGSSHSHSIAAFGTTETRPVNVALNYIIKT